MAVPPPRLMIPDKLALRARLRAERDRFAAESSSAILAPPAFAARLKPGTTVATYVPIGSEADPSPLARSDNRSTVCRSAVPSSAIHGSLRVVSGTPFTSST